MAGQWKARFMDRLLDYRYGVRTGGICATSVRDGHRCATIPYTDVIRILRAAGVGREDRLVDLGCGLGRVLLCAATLGAQRAVGYEADGRIAGLAAMNAARRVAVGTELRVEHALAQEWQPSDETVVYMFNPFGSTTLAEVVDRMRAAAWKEAGRRVVYVNPLYSHALERAGWLRKEWSRRIGVHEVELWSPRERSA